MIHFEIRLQFDHSLAVVFRDVQHGHIAVHV